MNIFKRIYYPALAVLMVLMMVLGFVVANFGGNKATIADMSKIYGYISSLSGEERSSINLVELNSAETYLISELTKFSLRADDDDFDSDGNNLAPFRNAGSPSRPSVTTALQTAIVSHDTIKDMMDDRDDSDMAIYAGKEVNNIITIFPGTDTKEGNADAGAIIIMAHYDALGTGAMSNASSVASMIANIIYLYENQNAIYFKNDIVFVFTDAKVDGGYGAYAFKNQFKGFNDVVSRAKLAINFDSFGTSGTLQLYKTSDNNAKLMADYASLNGSLYISSMASTIYSSQTKYTDLDAFSDIPSLGFANFGGADKYTTVKDSYDNIDKSIISQQINMINKLVMHYGNESLDSLDANSNAVYFSYLGLTINYHVAIAYVLGGIILALLGVIIYFNYRKKAFSWSKVGMGAAIQVGTILATVAVMFAAYFVITLLIAGFGVLPVTTISTIRYMNTGILLAAATFALSIMVAFYIILKRAFVVESPNVVRGNAILIALLGVIFSFFIPSMSFMFAYLAVLGLAVMLVFVLLKDKFKAKYGFAMEKLFLYFVPIILTAPILIPIISLASSASMAILLPIITIIFMLMAGSILPYADLLKPQLDKVFKKLPPKVVTYEREVTKMVEDAAKKGKFTEKTIIEVEKKKTPWNYLNRVGITFVCVVASVCALMFSVFGGTYTQNIASFTHSFDDYVYSGAIVYMYDIPEDTSEINTTLRVKDDMAYKFISKAIKDMTWDSTTRTYVKSAPQNLLASGAITNISKTDEDSYIFRVYDTSFSKFRVRISGLANAETITFTSLSRSSGQEFEFSNNSDEVEFTFPLGYGNFEMTIEPKEGAEVGALKFEFEDHVIGGQHLNSLTDIENLITYFSGDADVLPYIKTNVIIRQTVTLS